jgi:hypothetical protein
VFFCVEEQQQEEAERALACAPHRRDRRKSEQGEERRGGGGYRTISPPLLEKKTVERGTEGNPLDRERGGGGDFCGRIEEREISRWRRRGEALWRGLGKGEEEATPETTQQR